ncbi:MAG: hypothetical protein AAF234_06410 [Pseudomonadota bacterium]
MIRTAVLSLIFLMSASAAWAENITHRHGDHASMDESPRVVPVSLPREGGQSAFSAIAEIVEILDTDPHTNWATVNIGALQEHLLDMSLLTLETQVQTQQLAGGAAFTVEAEGRTKEAVQRMVLAHAPFLAAATGWDVSASLTDDGARLEVVSGNPRDVLKIQALGFYGLMATDSHHQEHHLAIATGQLDH